MHAVNAAVLERWKGLSDEIVVEQVLAGQTALFEVLMRRHNERIYRTIRAVLRSDKEVEEVMQQTYVNAYAHLSQFRGAARFSTWLTRIAINESLARAKQEERYTRFDEEQPRIQAFPTARPSDPEKSAAADELRGIIEEAIDRLPDGLREVFVLREVEGTSTAETAAALGVSDDVVKTRLSRARATLRLDLLQRIGLVVSDVFRFYRPRCDNVVAAVLERIS